MNLKALKKPELLNLARELGLQIPEAKRKPEIIEAIEAIGADDDELKECLESIEHKEEERKRIEEKEERERAAREAKEERERVARDALEMKRLEIELLRAQNNERPSTEARESERRMTDLMTSYAVGGDIGLFLVQFERVCEKQKFARNTWQQRLLTLLPREVADIIGRMGKEEAEDFDKVKASLLKKYRLSADAFRRKFREIEKTKKAGALSDAEKTMQCVALEQFFRRLPENIRYWVQDRPGVDTITRAADLAEEYVTRRALEGKEAPKEMNKYRPDKPERWSKPSQYKSNERSASRRHNTQAKPAEACHMPSFQPVPLGPSMQATAAEPLVPATAQSMSTTPPESRAPSMLAATTDATATEDERALYLR
ncbi:hypothetical protein HPB49_004876 [Dermacentor silvarum]|uniref:Uncharacterized protein n=1 Tax=Dermacentor silvarum TaxID=543639 RepID=A0ACB8DV21_DERSI|nr:hypothetical protein HPB49_004876 [Dermacentor silvarum]